MSILEFEPELRRIPQGIAAASVGRVIRVVHSNPDIASVIEAGFDRLLLERSVDGGVTFAEITTGDSRPVLKQHETEYVIRDREGDPMHQYRFRYVNTKECDDDRSFFVSEASDAIEGAGIAIRNILTPEEIKQRYMFGIDLTDDAGNALPDSVFEFFILAAIMKLEHELDIPILPTQFLNERHDYHRNEFYRFSLLQLDNYPVIDVDAFRIQFPSGQNVIEYPKEWFRVDKHGGSFQLVPTAGTLSQVFLGQGGGWLPAVFMGRDYFPHLFSVDYAAGFEVVPHNILDVIGMMAAIGPFNIFGDLIAGAGIANLSLSMDGLSQTIGTTSSATNSGYGSRIIQYTKQIKEQIPNLRRFYKGIRMVVA